MHSFHSGMRFTDQTETFRHTTEEKAEFLSDWLDAIDVRRCVQKNSLSSSLALPLPEAGSFSQNVQSA